MVHSRIRPFDTLTAHAHRSGVSLHSHTQHSKELLTFMPAWASRTPLVGVFVSHAIARYTRAFGHPPDFSLAFWTPPMSPRAVFESEKAQITSRLQLSPLVSITDHDTIEAGVALAGLGLGEETPLSVEWSVPYRGTVFHLGIHNLPPEFAAEMMTHLAAYTRAPTEVRLRELLVWLNEQPQTLIVLNHPFWNRHVDCDQDLPALAAIIDHYGTLIHATEVNGFRGMAENRRVVNAALDWDLPVVAGGDRHGRATNPLLNVSSATTFAGFVEEVRRGRVSDGVVMPEYRECLGARVLASVAEILQHDDALAPDRAFWTQRLFVTWDDGIVRPIAASWGETGPWWVRLSVRTVCTLGSPRGRLALRLALTAEDGEMTEPRVDASSTALETNPGLET